MEHGRWNLDRASLAAVVTRTVCDIDASTHEERNGLLFVLLSAAWGDLPARDQ